MERGDFQDIVHEAAELRREALATARADAVSGLPDQNAEGPAESEIDLRERCAAAYERWQLQECARGHSAVTKAELRLSERLFDIAQKIDRFERIVDAVRNLRIRTFNHRQQEKERDSSTPPPRLRRLRTVAYAGALTTIGLVGVIINAPTAGALLPPNQWADRQMERLMEMAQGWTLGLEHAMGEVAFRPGASIVALGVMFVACILAHLLGATLRDLFAQARSGKQLASVSRRSIHELCASALLSTVGLALILTALTDARGTLGQIHVDRHDEEVAESQALREEAGELRDEGLLADAGALEDRAEAAEERGDAQLEQATIMERGALPALLINIALILSAITAAFLHRRSKVKRGFAAEPFQEQQKALIEDGERVAEEVGGLMAEAIQDLRNLKVRTQQSPLDGWRSVAQELEAVVVAYRAENARMRKLNPEDIRPFRTPVRLVLARSNGDPGDPGVAVRTPGEYQKEQAELETRFAAIRARFIQELSLCR